MNIPRRSVVVGHTTILSARALNDFRFQYAFAAYQSVAEDHLLHEEAVWMPLVARLPEPRAAKFAQWCLPAGLATGG